MAVGMFLSFAFAYFFAGLLRGVTVNLASHFSTELGLSAGDLGLQGGACSLSLASMQLPLGSALDRFSPKRVLISLLCVASAGCIAFALARNFLALTFARGLTGVGVSACLMAPMTCYKRRFSPVAQMRANSWMLMSGSMGVVASTLPVQWLPPQTGRRGLFWITAGCIAAATALFAQTVPQDE